MPVPERSSVDPVATENEHLRAVNAMQEHEKADLRAEVERLREQADDEYNIRVEVDRKLDAAYAEVERLREALREAIGWSYGDGPTPERRDEVERLLNAS